MRNNNFYSVNHLEMVVFSIALLVYWRVMVLALGKFDHCSHCSPEPWESWLVRGIIPKWLVYRPVQTCYQQRGLPATFVGMSEEL